VARISSSSLKFGGGGKLRSMFKGFRTEEEMITQSSSSSSTTTKDASKSLWRSSPTIAGIEVATGALETTVEEEPTTTLDASTTLFTTL